MQRGGIAVRIVFIAATLALVGAAIVWLLQNFQLSQESNRRKAVQVCEFGLQQALEKLSRDPAWNDGFGPTSSGGGLYRVTLRHEVSGDTAVVLVESEGRCGSAMHRKRCRMTRVVAGNDTIWTPRYQE